MADAVAALTHALHDWTPVRLVRAGADFAVEWAVVPTPFGDAFFEQSAERAMRRPFNLAFAQRTALAALVHDAAPLTREPDGFVFHLSRSGSTLTSQMLRALDDTIVIAEAQPLDALLALRGAEGWDDERIAAALRAMLGALARPRHDERRFFVKWTASAVHALPLIARAFPSVPWTFLFREPLAVLASQLEMMGGETLLRQAVLRQAQDDMEPAAQIVASAQAALAMPLGAGVFIDYAALPNAVFDTVLPAFGVTPTDAETARLRDVGKRDAKAGGTPFQPRPPAAPPNVDAATARRLADVYARLCARAES